MNRIDPFPRNSPPPPSHPGTRRSRRIRSGNARLRPGTIPAGLPATPANEPSERNCGRAETRALFALIRAMTAGIVGRGHAGPLSGRDTRRDARHVRTIAIYVCHVVAGISMSEIARAVGRHRTTISYTCGLIEDRRDEAVFDALVGTIEDELRSCLAVPGRLSHD